MFAEAGGMSGEARGQIFPARGSARFAGQRPVRQRSLSAASLFGYFFGEKSNWLRAAKSATMLVQINKSRYLPIVACFVPYNKSIVKN